MVVSIVQKDAVSEFVGTLNGKMASLLFQRYESLERQYWVHRPWAGEDCLSTKGLDQEQKRKYVQWQEEQET